MNFSPFGSHFSTTIPTIHQIAAKFSQENSANSFSSSQETNSNRYTANGVPSFTQHHPATQQQMANVGKYQGNYVNQSVYGNTNNVVQEKRQHFDHQELAQELCNTMLQQQGIDKGQNSDKMKQVSHVTDRRNHQQSQLNTSQSNLQNSQSTNSGSSMTVAWQSLSSTGSSVADYLSHLPTTSLPLSLHHFLKYSAENMKKETVVQQLNLQNNDANINLLPNNTINMNHLNNGLNTNLLTSNVIANNNTSLGNVPVLNTSQIPSVPSKRKKKKKPEKEKKPRPKPGEIRLTTALDGSTLYCCPECHMAYPEKELLEQHLVGHTLERRFVCDICGAGLKRKDHLTRHKQSHNPERPYVCTVCLKAFKRKEQLTLHFVIHSGEKRHVCTECGKGFYRKDHLRKHTRSHIARRVKAELSQQGNSTPSLQIHSGATAGNSGSIPQGIIS